MLKKKIRKFRIEAGMTQYELGVKVGSMSKNPDKYISAIERDENISLSIEKFVSICKAIGVPDMKIIHVVCCYLNLQNDG